MINSWELQILDRANERSPESGIDTYDTCWDKTWFSQYRHKITYEFNSRGFRDAEWPENVDNVIWCVGDSFTSGVGVPYSHVWPQVLSRLGQRRTINISLDGASNNWMARQINTIIDAYKPDTIVVHWSFIPRRESTLSDALDQAWAQYYHKISERAWPTCKTIAEIKTLPSDIQQKLQVILDDHTWWHNYDIESLRRLQYIKTGLDEDWQNLQDCISLISKQQSTKIIHSFIPDWHAGLNPKQNFNFHGHPSIEEIKQVDRGRDGFHYDIKTARLFCQQIMKILNSNDSSNTSDKKSD